MPIFSCTSLFGHGQLNLVLLGAEWISHTMGKCQVHDRGQQDGGLLALTDWGVLGGDGDGGGEGSGVLGGVQVLVDGKEGERSEG